ncbi:MAG: hypothetical protein HZB56_04330 [Deltaproteobacteria bacterium]|nr:hypothetical protein [Deltaproteobacteria bacterium]
MAPATEERALSAGKLAWVGLALAAAALLSSWNPFAAPFGLILGVASGGLGLWLLRRRRGSRPAAAGALTLGALAALVSALVLWLGAGAVTAELTGEPVVKARTAAEAGALLDAARAASDPVRQRARKELEAAAAGAGGAPAESAKEDVPLEPAPPPPEGEDEDEPE